VHLSSKHFWKKSFKELQKYINFVSFQQDGTPSHGILSFDPSDFAFSSFSNSFPLPMGIDASAGEEVLPRMESSTEFWRRACRIAEQLLLLYLGVLIGVVFGNVHVFGHRMGKNEAKAQEHHHDSHPMT
jgi:hypothetical protein